MTDSMTPSAEERAKAGIDCCCSDAMTCDYHEGFADGRASREPEIETEFQRETRMRERAERAEADLKTAKEFARAVSRELADEHPDCSNVKAELAALRARIGESPTAWMGSDYYGRVFIKGDMPPKKFLEGRYRLLTVEDADK